MIQISILNPTNQRKILRATTTLSRTRPGENTRWVQAAPFLKPTLEEGEWEWLGSKWRDAIKEKEGNFRGPSINEIMIGIQEEEKLN